MSIKKRNWYKIFLYAVTIIFLVGFLYLKNQGMNKYLTRIYKEYPPISHIKAYQGTVTDIYKIDYQGVRDNQNSVCVTLDGITKLSITTNDGINSGKFLQNVLHNNVRISKQEMNDTLYIYDYLFIEHDTVKYIFIVKNVSHYLNNL
jgi:hypothetical protein